MRATFLFLIFSFAWVMPTSLWAQGKGSSSYSLQLGHADTYIFRGHVYNSEPTLFGELAVGIGKWSYRLNYADPLEESILSPSLFENEYVHEVGYTAIVGRKIITYGYRFYDYSDGFLPDTQEIFSRVAHDRKWNPTYGITLDFDTYRGYYLDFSLTRFWSVTRKSQLIFNLRGGGSLDMDEERNDEDLLLEPAYFDDNGVNHGSAHLKYAWQPHQRIKLETGIDYHYAFDDALYDEVLIERDQVIWRTSVTLRMP